METLQLVVLFFSGVLFIYVIICLFYYHYQYKFIFEPVKEHLEAPDQYGLDFEEINISRGHDHYVNSWFIPCSNGNGLTILFCHGNSGNISHRRKTIEHYHNLGFNFFVFDYSGYGKSKGKPGEIDFALDAVVAWKYLVKEKQIPPEKIVVLGRSLGGFPASFIASLYQPAALILESTFISLQNVARDRYFLLPVEIFVKVKMSNLDLVENISSPLLLIHSKDDKIVRCYHSETLYKQAHVPKQLVYFAGSHNGCYYEDTNKYSETVLEFLKKNNII